MTLADIPTQDLINELLRRRDEINDCIKARSIPDEDMEVIKAAADAFAQPVGAMFAMVRLRRVTDPRQAAMVILRQRGRTHDHISGLFKLTHGAVVHAVKTHAKRMSDAAYADSFFRAQSFLSI